MGFLIRSAFWFSLVLLALPLNTGTDGTPSVGAIQAFMAAREAIGDISAICERKPDVCETGKSAMHTVGIRAREAARIAYEMLDENLGDKASGSAEPMRRPGCGTRHRDGHGRHRRDHRSRPSPRADRRSEPSDRPAQPHGHAFISR